MTRSIKKTPKIAVTTATSDKQYKTREHRRERTTVKQALATGGDIPHHKEFGGSVEGR